MNTAPLDLDEAALKAVWAILRGTVPPPSPVRWTLSLRQGWVPALATALYLLSFWVGGIELSLVGLVLLCAWMWGSLLRGIVVLPAELRRAPLEELHGLEQFSSGLLAPLAQLARYDDAHLSYAQAVVEWRITALEARVGALLGLMRQTGVVFATVTVGAALLTVANLLLLPDLARVVLFGLLLAFGALSLHFLEQLEILGKHRRLLEWARLYRKG